MEEEKEIEIVFQPIKKIVIFECLEFSAKEFFERVELIVSSGQPLALNWAEGIVFLALPYPPDSEIIIEEALKGTMYWASVMFASMPKYEPIKRFGARELPIINQSSIPHFRQVAKWLKNRSKPTEPP